MDVNLLVVSPNPQFGRLIQHSLTQGGVYRVQLCESAAEAYAQVGQINFNMAILDLESADTDLIAMARRFQQGSAGLPLVIFPPANDPTSPLLEDVHTQAYLMKPFYLPDMAETVERVLQSRSVSLAAEKDTNAWQFYLAPEFNLSTLPWISDRDEAVNYITNLAQDSGAEAALVIQHGELSGYAGRLEKDSADQITAIVQPNSDLPDNDSARFISLPGSSRTFLVYTTYLVEDLVLGLVYDTSTPLSHIRSQAEQISSNPAGIEGETRMASEAAPKPELKADWVLEETELPAEIQPQGIIPASEMGQAAEIGDEETVKLEEVVPVTPSAGDLQEAWIPEISPGLAEPLEPTLPDQPTPEVESFLADAELEAPPVDILADTHPRLYRTSDEIPSYHAPSLSNLTYTGVLIPRLPEHHLVGELAGILPQVFATVCLGFGWNLEGLLVDPDHVVWIIRTSPATAPARLLARLRRHTSALIFKHSTHLKDENLSGDFWSPGYLVISGARALPAGLLQQYIAEIRQRQGITDRRNPENG